jgi:outer membrane murein-binding lipoprotein Lpp
LSKRLIVLLAGVLAIGLIVAGCGSSDDSDSTSSLTKAQFIKQADAICEEESDAIEAETKAYAEENGIPIDKEPSDEVKEDLVTEVIVPNVEGQAEKIAALGAPSGDEDRVDEIIEGIETAAAETSDDPSAVISGGEGAFADVNQLAEDYGLEVCGEG